MPKRPVTKDQMRVYPNEQLTEFADSVSDQLETKPASEHFTVAVMTGDLAEFRKTPAMPQGWPEIVHAIHDQHAEGFLEEIEKKIPETRWVAISQGEEGERQIVMPRGDWPTDLSSFCIYQATTPNIIEVIGYLAFLRSRKN